MSSAILPAICATLHELTATPVAHDDLLAGVRARHPGATLAIGRQADPLVPDDLADRMKAARARPAPLMSRASSLSTKLKAWFAVSDKEQSMI